MKRRVGRRDGRFMADFVQSGCGSCDPRASGSSRRAEPSALCRSALNGVKRRCSAGRGRTSSGGTIAKRQLPQSARARLRWIRSARAGVWFRLPPGRETEPFRIEPRRGFALLDRGDLCDAAARVRSAWHPRRTADR